MKSDISNSLLTSDGIDLRRLLIAFEEREYAKWLRVVLILVFDGTVVTLAETEYLPLSLNCVKAVVYTPSLADMSNPDPSSKSSTYYLEIQLIIKNIK